MPGNGNRMGSPMLDGRTNSGVNEMKVLIASLFVLATGVATACPGDKSAAASKDADSAASTVVATAATGASVQR